MTTQWNVTMGGVIGLKYDVLEWFCRIYYVKDVQSMLEGIQIMEKAALDVFNKDTEK
tara:strand:- start:216 stop:386 length:171 start_codon:yes stop_codon:yes gene_type:complete